MLELFVELSVRGDQKVSKTFKRLEAEAQRTEDKLGNVGDGMDQSARNTQKSAKIISGALKGVGRDADKLDGKRVSLKTELKGAGEVTSGLEAIKNRRDSLDRGRITLETSLRGASGVISELGTLEGVSSRIDGDKVLLTADVDGTAEGIAGLQSLQSVASRIDGDNLRMKVDVDGAPQAISELAAINQVADRVDGRNVNLKTNSGVSALEALGASLDSVASRIRTIQTIALPAVLPGLVGIAGAIPAVVTPAVAALGALAGAMGAGLAGTAAVGGGAATAFAGSLGLIIGPVAALLAKLGEYDKSVDKVASKQKTAATAAESLADAERGAADAARGVADAREAAAQGVADAESAYQDALRGVEDAERKVAESRRGVVDARRDASADVVSAEKDYADALRDVEDAERAVAVARRGVNDARQEAAADVASAERDYSDALQDVAAAEEDLTRARADAGDAAVTLVQAEQELSDLRDGDEARNLAEAEDDLTRSRLEVGEAQEKYNEAVSEYGRNSREAKLAALDLRDAERQVAEQEEETSEIRRLGSEEYRSAIDNVRGAKRGLQNANDAVRDSEQGVVDAQLAAADKQAAIQTAQQEGARKIADAQRGVADAQRDLQDAQAEAGAKQAAIDEARQEGARKVADAQRTVADSQRALADAQRDARKAEAGIAQARNDGAKQVAAALRAQEDAQRAVAQAAEALAEAEKGVLDEIIPLTAAQKHLYDEFQRFKGIASAAFTPAMDQAARLGVQILKLGASYMPRLGTASLATMQALTRVFGTFRRELSQPVEQASINRFLRTIPRFTEVAGNAFVRFSLGMINFFARTLPYVMQFTNYLDRSATAFLNWTRSASGMAQIDAFLAYTTQKAKELWRALQNTGAGFLGLFSAMNQAGMVDQVWGGFLRLTQQFRELTQAGTESRAGVVRFFESSKPILSALWSLVGTLVTEWFRVAGAVMRMRDETGKLVLPQVLKDMEGVLRTIGDLLIGAFRAFGPYIGPITQGLAEFFKYFIAYNPVLAFFSRIIARAATAFTNLDSGTKKAIVSFISARAAFAIFGTALMVLISPMTKLLGLIGGGSTALKGLGLVMGGISAPVAIVVGAIAALAAGFVYLYRNNEQFRNGVNAAWAQIKAFVLPIIRQVAGAVKQGLGVAFRFVQNQGLRLLNWFRTNWPQFRAAVLPILRQIGNGIKNGLVAAFRFVLNQGRRLVNWFKTNWPQIRAAVFPVVRAIANVMRNVLVGAFRFALNNARLVVNWFRKNWPLIKRTTGVVFNGIKAIIVPTMRFIWNRVIKPILGYIVRFWRNNWRLVENILRSAWNIIKSVVRTAIKNVLNIIKLAMQLITGDWRGAWQTIKNIARDNWNNIKTIIRNAIRIVTDIVKIGLNQIKGIWERVTSAIRRWVQGWSKNVRNAFNYLVNRGKAIFQNGWDGVRRIWERATSGIREWVQGWSKNIRGIWNELVNAAGRIFGRIGGLIQTPMEKAYDIIQGIWNRLLDGIAGVMEKLGMKEEAKKLSGSKMADRANSKKAAGPGEAAFAKGGINRPGGMSDTPRVLYGEAGPEAYVRLDKKTPESQRAARAVLSSPNAPPKYGRNAPPEYVPKAKKRQHRHMARGGLIEMATGGQLGETQMIEAVTSRWSGVKLVDRHNEYLPPAQAAGAVDFFVAPGGTVAQGANRKKGDEIANFLQPPSTQIAVWMDQMDVGSGWQPIQGAVGIGNENSLQHRDHVHAQAWSDDFKGGLGKGGLGSIGNVISEWVSTGAEKLFGKLMKDTVNPAAKKMSSGNTVLGSMAGNLLKTQFAEGIESFLSNKFGGSDGSVTGNFTGSQAEVAAKFAAESKKRGMPGELPVITALVESGMKNLNYGDRDSVGYFQQRPSQGWGSVQQLQDPAYALDAFLDVAEGLKGQYGNDAVSQGNWAQAVQRSAFPDRYAQEFSNAQSLIQQGAGGKKGAGVGYTDGGMPIKPHNAMVEPHDLYLPLDNQRVMRSAQTALGTAELRQDNAMLRNELAGLRSDLVQFGIRVSDMDEPAAQKMGKAAREGAKGHLDSRDGKRQVNNISKSQVNRSAKVGGNRGS